jgi:hypothetical protein
MLWLCFTPYYGGHTDDQLFKGEVYPFMTVVPKFYRKMVTNERFVLLCGDARAEDNFRKFEASQP